MKRKLVATLLATATLSTMVACGTTAPEVDITTSEPAIEQEVEVEVTDEEEVVIEDVETEQTQEEVTVEPEPEIDEPAAEGEGPEVDAEEVVTDSVVANALRDYFLTSIEGYDGDVNKLTDIAAGITQNCGLPFELISMEIEPGLLTGFGNAEITGFTQGVQFMPMIGTTPFVGYIFELEDGMPADAFMAELEANYDLRWNICTSADVATYFAVNNVVFFTMHPAEFEYGME